MMDWFGLYLNCRWRDLEADPSILSVLWKSCSENVTARCENVELQYLHSERSAEVGLWELKEAGSNFVNGRDQMT
ncbi:unnamed protein product [Arabidopsis halleri]